MQGKIINDPVYGFIKFPEKELMDLIEHPWFQRLRNIKQMGMAHYVYPGAVHTRFHHSLGAAHLMQTALTELRNKGIVISQKVFLAARQAILLHDIGHGPFSHALENTLITNVSHEEISKLIMEELCEQGYELRDAISIFDNNHPDQYLHQLVSSQLDMDRMDYLNRDSFYTGVSEGVIGYDRILQMLAVSNGNLAVEEKGVHSVEKFIIARRLMYWQVYLHKTVLSAELLIVNILRRAKMLASRGQDLFATPALRFFLYEQISSVNFSSDKKVLSLFCELDDTDIIASAKVWMNHKDAILATLCKMMIFRRLYKVKMSNERQEEVLENKKTEIINRWKINEEDCSFFVFDGIATNSTYNQHDERITILMKDERVMNISEMDNTIINSGLSIPVEKHYVCYPSSDIKFNRANKPLIY